MSSLGVRLQQLPQSTQALILASLLVNRSEDGVFTPAELEDLFEEAALPPPSRVGNSLITLQRQGLAVSGARKGVWRISPKGRQRITEIFPLEDLHSLEAELIGEGSSALAGLRHPVVPPALAPPELAEPLSSFLKMFPFETNVFAMTRYPGEPEEGAPPDPISGALQVAEGVCDAYGLKLHLASDRSIHDDLWTNVAGHMWGSRFGIAFFEERQAGLNYNLSIEVGAMLMTGRRTALLRDTSVGRMPTDLVGRIYKAIDLDDLSTVESALTSWVEDDLGL